jgi:hypothetical protein
MRASDRLGPPAAQWFAVDILRLGGYHIKPSFFTASFSSRV